MIIQMSNREFQEIRKFIIGLKNPKANKMFNEIFSSEPTGGVKGFVNPLNKDIVIDIPEHLAFEIFKVFVNHSADIAKLAKGGSSITNAPKWLAFLKNIFADLQRAVTKR